MFLRHRERLLSVAKGGARFIATGSDGFRQQPLANASPLVAARAGQNCDRPAVRVSLENGEEAIRILHFLLHLSL